MPTMSSAEFSPPLAVLITLRTYGTWLPGSTRGWSHRPTRTFRNPDRRILLHSRSLMKWPPVHLDAEQRETLHVALRGLCATRSWVLLADAVMTEHVHVVVRAEVAGPSLRTSIKTRLTMALKVAGLFPKERQLWCDYGSVKPLRSERAVTAACAYVERHHRRP